MLRALNAGMVRAARSPALDGRVASLVQRRGLAAGYVESVTELIGSTPMVRLNKVSAAEGVDPSTKVLIKLEMQNPGGSVKDRIALSSARQTPEKTRPLASVAPLR